MISLYLGRLAHQRAPRCALLQLEPAPEPAPDNQRSCQELWDLNAWRPFTGAIVARPRIRNLFGAVGTETASTAKTHSLADARLVAIQKRSSAQTEREDYPKGSPEGSAGAHSGLPNLLNELETEYNALLKAVLNPAPIIVLDDRLCASSVKPRGIRTT